jgi:hypothetical protein
VTTRTKGLGYAVNQVFGGAAFVSGGRWLGNYAEPMKREEMGCNDIGGLAIGARGSANGDVRVRPHAAA